MTNSGKASGTLELTDWVKLHTSIADFQAASFRETPLLEHLAILYGSLQNGMLVRIHSECLTGDVFGSLNCDCRSQLVNSLSQIVDHSSGLCLYLRQEGRGIGLFEKIRAYGLQQFQGLDTLEANAELGHAFDERSYEIVGALLFKLGLSEIRLITNNPHKAESLRSMGIVVAEQVPAPGDINPKNRQYLRTKREKCGHTISMNEPL